MSWGERDSIHNLRRLPGVGRTCLFRSAVPGDLALSAPQLVASGAESIHTVVDLREPSEIVEFPDEVPEHVRYLNVPLYRGPVPKNEAIDEVYTQLLQHRGTQLATAVHTLIIYADAGALVHCTAGKDRTGLVVALLLSVAGVDRELILDDYQKSASELPASYHAKIASQMALNFDTASEEFTAAMALHTESQAEVLGQALEHLDFRYGSVAAYLRAHGLPEAAEHELKKLVD